MQELEHWVGGKSVRGTSGVPVPSTTRPAGCRRRSSRSASDDEVDAAVGPRPRPPPSGRPDRSARGRPSCSVSVTSWPSAAPDLAAAVTAEHGKVLSDAAGEVARGLDNIEFGCGIPHLLEGLPLHRGVGWCRRPYHPRATRCGRRHHAVQLSRNGPPLDVGQRDRVWERLRSQAFREGPVPVAAPSRAGQGGGRARRRPQRGARRPRRSGRTLGAPRRRRRVFRGQHTHRPATCTRRAPAHGKRVQALGGAKNHMVVLPDADVGAAADAAISAGFGSAGERCMAISVVVAVGAVGDQLVDAIAARMPSVVVGPGTDPDSQMGPLVTAEHRDRVRPTSTAPKRRVRGSWWTAARRVARGLLLGCTLLDGVRPGMRVYDDEIFGPVLSVVRVGTYEEAVSLVNRAPTATGRPSSPVTAAPPGAFSARSRQAWSASTSPSPCPWASTPSEAGSPLFSATPPCTGPRASASTPGPRWSRPAGPIRRPARSTSVSPDPLSGCPGSIPPWPRP